MSIFIVGLLLFLWLFQVVFLDQFYRSIKINNVKSAAVTIAGNIDNENILNIVSEVSGQNELCVRIIGLNQQDLLAKQDNLGCSLSSITYNDLNNFYENAINHNGTYLHSQNLSTIREGVNWFKYGFNNKEQEIIYVQMTQDGSNNEVMILLNARISPINTTGETIRAQLIYIFMIVILASLVLVVIMSKRIVNPIMAMNNSAKLLAKGEFDLQFKGKGYLEITELNDSLNKACIELNKVENYRKELIANVSHDLRTPLTMISGYSEVMRDIPGENSPENIQIIIDEAKRLSNLVNDLMALSKFQGEGQSLNLTQTNLTYSIKKILQRYTKLKEQEGYQLSFEFDQEVSLMMDEAKIEQVLYNLINNAINYTGDDLKITIKQIVSEDTVRIEVIDTGIGIESDQLELIFDRYYKSNQMHKRAVVGTGLGLSIVKSILQLHNAKYGVESILNEGSTFWFEMKLK